MPITAIHPGEHLAQELQALVMSASELARQNCRTNEWRYADLKRHSWRQPRYRVALAHFFATSAQFWLNLQTLYDYAWLKSGAGSPSRHFPL
jgi:antitoxin HigA-1